MSKVIHLKFSEPENGYYRVFCGRRFPQANRVGTDLARAAVKTGESHWCPDCTYIKGLNAQFDSARPSTSTSTNN